MGWKDAPLVEDAVKQKWQSAPLVDDATWQDRAQAAKGGLLSGSAYLATSPLDAVANAFNLVKAGAGFGYSQARSKEVQEPAKTPGGLFHFVGPDNVERFSKNAPPAGSTPVTHTVQGDVPSWLNTSGPNPVGGWLTNKMDKTDALYTGIRHPEDPASRWIHTATSVIPGALAGGGGTIRGTLQALTGGLGGAGAAQGIHELHPFDNPTGQALAETGASILGSMAGSAMVPGAPVRTPQNEAVMEGQEHGYRFPAATTNPTPINKLIARISGGATVQDEAQARNQPLTNAGVREDLNLPGQGPIRPDEVQSIRRQTNADYNAVANSGATFQRDAPLVQALQQARSRYTNTSRLSPTLASSPAAERINELMGITQAGGRPRIGTIFGTQDGVATVESLRDAARTSARNSEMGDAAAYRQAATAVEDAMDRSLSQNPSTAGLVQAWHDARVRRAQLHSAEEAMDPNGNIDATKLGKMYADNEPLTGNMAIAARSANAARKAFRVPESGPTGGHGGFWGPLTGALVGGEASAKVGELIGSLFGHPEAGAVAGVAPIATYGAYVASRAAARRAALARALATQKEAPNYLGGLGATYVGTRSLVPVTP